jgi:hypothetical protein
MHVSPYLISLYAGPNSLGVATSGLPEQPSVNHPTSLGEIQLIFDRFFGIKICISYLNLSRANTNGKDSLRASRTTASDLFYKFR